MGGIVREGNILPKIQAETTTDAITTAFVRAYDGQTEEVNFYGLLVRGRVCLKIVAHLKDS